MLKGVGKYRDWDKKPIRPVDLEKVHRELVAPKDPEICRLLNEGFILYSNYDTHYEDDANLFQARKQKLEAEHGPENVFVSSNAYDGFGRRRRAGVVALWFRESHQST